MSDRIGSPDNLHVEVRMEGPTTILLLRGELDMTSAPSLEEQLRRLGDREAILVDLHGLTFMDVRGLNVLLDAQREAAQRGGNLTVMNLGCQVRSMLGLVDVKDSWMLFDRAKPPKPPTPPSLSVRDRLLLAFANLNSYGIAAHPHLPGHPEAIHAQLANELRIKYPHGLVSYVFWLATDDTRFRPDGSLPSMSELPLHYGSDDVVPAVIAACADMSIEISRDRQQRVLLARDAESGSKPHDEGPASSSR
jgi:anti-sigma B factor antagonist